MITACSSGANGSTTAGIQTQSTNIQVREKQQRQKGFSKLILKNAETVLFQFTSFPYLAFFAFKFCT